MAEYVHGLRMTTFWHHGGVASAYDHTEAFLEAYSEVAPGGTSSTSRSTGPATSPEGLDF